METLKADLSASVTEFKRSPTRLIEQAAGRPLAVLVNNRPAFYALSAEAFERIADILDDRELAETAQQRLRDGDFVETELDEL
ncbi:type II toxin-antitoxin system Phd/YefM family antitoxin [Wenzhouxiangella limi]|uniref:Antitoxin n=1 Tax=Wenzhouxiangella limi TaxID=2707351 RepID=A0A845V1V0_9GAMM|nr:type II toxin-antitoxin system Phd/YefM family antitoxin [Wenzhouxiangella limi]NDY95236.1 prevent-host-death protein [Wenzhouxiangella limi]